MKGMYIFASGASGRLFLNDLHVASRPLNARKRTDGTQFVLLLRGIIMIFHPFDLKK